MRRAHPQDRTCCSTSFHANSRGRLHRQHAIYLHIHHIHTQHHMASLHPWLSLAAVCARGSRTGVVPACAQACRLARQMPLPRLTFRAYTPTQHTQLAVPISDLLRSLLLRDYYPYSCRTILSRPHDPLENLYRSQSRHPHTHTPHEGRASLMYASPPDQLPYTCISPRHLTIYGQPPTHLDQLD